MFLSGRICKTVITVLVAISFNFISPDFLNAAELILSWQDNSNNEDGFEIERSVSGSGPFETIAILGPDSSSYTDSSISHNIEYCYRVTAFNANGSSSSAVGCNTATQPSGGDDINHILGEALIIDDFEGYGAGQDPENWKDTGKNNSFNEVPNLFKTKAVGNTIAFGTDSPDTNIHSHYIGGEALSWRSYIYTGRMYITDSGGGIGVTFFSRFPEERDVYYRLRRYAQKPKFHLSAHGTSVKGDKDSGVAPDANGWYRFHIEVEDAGTQTNIRVKVWKETEGEPADFQINAYDDSGSRITYGTIGVWTMGSGTKLFDDLAVQSLGFQEPIVLVNNSPVAIFDMDPPESAIVGETIFFDARGSYDPDNDPLSYTWVFGDGYSGAGETANHSFSDPGTYDVTLTVSDTELTDSTTSQLTVDLPVNSVPVAVATVEPGTSALPGETLFFDGSGSHDPDGHPLSYTWDFGDGSTATGAEVSHSFSEPGMYEVLLVVDDGQLSDTEIIEIVVDVKPQSLLLSENFEGYGTGEDPEFWLDTEKNNSFVEDPNFFTTRALQNTIVFGTDSGDTNIHSHYIGEDALNWTNYTYTGRMYITDSGAGIGVTFFSRYPEGRDVYYRLRRYSRKPKFHVSAHGTSLKGNRDSGVAPDVETWYRFHIEVEDTGTRTNIRAKVWKEGEDEPADFQIDAYDNRSSRISSGTVGVWTMGSGTKLFDDLEVEPRL